MRKRTLFIFSATLAVFLAGAAYYIFFSDITEDRYNKIMCYDIARGITDRAENFDDKVIAIRDFVHENVLPVPGYHNRPDTRAIEKLTSGIGWCDQDARVFMQLARSVGITTRLLFLKLASGSSPHSMAEALAPDGRWIIVDTMYKLNLINKDGKPATQADIKNDLSIIADNKRVKLRAKFEKRWTDPAYLAIYSNPPDYVVTKEGVKIDFLKFLPAGIIKPVAKIMSDRYLDKIKSGIEDIYEFKMIKARAYHLLGYYEKSEKLYGEIIMNSGNLPLIHKTRFYNAILLKDQKRYDDACNYITGIIDRNGSNPYLSYLRGLRSRIFEKMGKPLEAERDLVSIQYDLEA